MLNKIILIAVLVLPIIGCGESKCDNYDIKSGEVLLGVCLNKVRRIKIASDGDCEVHFNSDYTTFKSNEACKELIKVVREYRKKRS